MSSAIKIRTDFSSSELRRQAVVSKNVPQSRRLLSLAAILDGMSREEAARIGGMDRQTLRDWVHRFNAQGLDDLKNLRSSGGGPRLSPEQQARLAAIVEAGPDREKDGVVRWRRIDLKRVVEERFGVAYHERTIGKILNAWFFSYVRASAPPWPECGRHGRF